MDAAAWCCARRDRLVKEEWRGGVRGVVGGNGDVVCMGQEVVDLVGL